MEQLVSMTYQAGQMFTRVGIYFEGQDKQS
jgi:hypothetical protein